MYRKKRSTSDWWNSGMQHTIMWGLTTSGTPVILCIFRLRRNTSLIMKCMCAGVSNDNVQSQRIERSVHTCFHLCAYSLCKALREKTYIHAFTCVHILYIKRRVREQKTYIYAFIMCILSKFKHNRENIHPCCHLCAHSLYKAQREREREK